MLSDPPRLKEAPLSTSWSPVSAMWLAAGVVGIALLVNITVAGPTSLATIGIPWLASLLLFLAGACLWWGLYLWLLNRLGGLGSPEGMKRSAGLAALLSLSLLPALAVFLSGRLPWPLVFDGYIRSLYVWTAGLLVFAVFLGQEAVLAGAVQRKGVRELLASLLRPLRALPRGIGRLPGAMVGQMVCHPLLVVVLIAGVVQRWVGKNDYDPNDMNDMLSVVYTILTWPPVRYYHDYNPQTYIFAHLPLFPILMAPLYWLFENVAKVPTAWSAMLLSAIADLGVAVLLYTQARGRWRGALGLILAVAWLLSPVVAGSDDHPVSFAAAFTVAALASLQRSWLCGLLLALAVSCRTEALFVVLPFIFHFLARRELREKAGFLGAFLTTLAVVSLPFFLYDPGAIIFAMFLQGERQASGELATALRLLQPYMGGAFDFLSQQRPSLPSAAMTLIASLLAIRDRRVSRVVVVVALVYVLTIPVLHARYMVLFYCAGLFYAARYSNPLVALAIVAASWYGVVENLEPWPGPVWALAVMFATAVALAGSGVAAIRTGERT